MAILNIAVTSRANTGYESINEQLRDSFYHNPKIEAMLQKKEQQVLSGNLTSFIAAKSLLDTYFEDLKM